MKIPRRTFIKAGIIAAACAGVPVALGPASAQDQQDGSRQRGGYFPIPPEVQNDPTSYYTMATFAPYVNTGFYILLNRKWVTMRLVELKDHCPKPAGQSVQNYGECFSLTFRAARGWKIDQKVYTLRHAALGTFSLFLVPVGRRTRTSLEFYEAVINRRTQ